jgi:hypothetical protein
MKDGKVFNIKVYARDEEHALDLAGRRVFMIISEEVKQ